MVMRNWHRSGLFYFVLWILVLELLTRTIMVDRAFLSTYNEVTAVDGALSRYMGVPEVVYLGSSQTQTGVTTREIEKLSGLTPGSIINASIAAAGPREMLYILESNKEKLSSARVVYINVDYFMFNRHIHMDEKKGPVAWRRTASLLERLQFPADAATRADWILGWVTRTWDLRETWRVVLVDKLQSMRTRTYFSIFDDYGRPLPALVGQQRTITPAQLHEEAQDTVRRHMQSFALNLDSYSALDQLVKLIREMGAEAVFLRMPVAGQFNMLMSSDYEIERVLIWNTLMTRFPDVDMLDLSSLIDFLSFEDLRDANHLSTKGALKMAHPLAEDLISRLGR